VTCIEEKRNALKILVGKPEGRRRLRRFRLRWEDNTEIGRGVNVCGS
jgi:hypothetical protein